VETFKRTNKYKAPILTEKEFNAYFPDFNNQSAMYEKMVSKNRVQLLDNSKKPEYQNIIKQIQLDVSNSYLPKLSQEMFHAEYCRLTKKEYIPKFSKEEHLKDMIKLHKKNPDLLKEAIRQSGYIQDKSINRLFSQDMMTRTNQITTQQNQNEKNVQTRTDKMINNQLVNSNTNTHHHTFARTR
jgi:hypothetical protein